MADPSEKTPAMEQFIDEVSKNAFGRSRTESIRSDVCVLCGGVATEFRDELSMKRKR